MESLRGLIISGELNGNIPGQYKPIIISHFFNAEVYGDGIQSFFEVYLFSLDDVLQAFQILKVSPELMRVIKEAKTHKYIMDEELYGRASGDE